MTIETILDLRNEHSISYGGNWTTDPDYDEDIYGGNDIEFEAYEVFVGPDDEEVETCKTVKCDYNDYLKLIKPSKTVKCDYNDYLKLIKTSKTVKCDYNDYLKLIKTSKTPKTGKWNSEIKSYLSNIKK